MNKHFFKIAISSFLFLNITFTFLPIANAHRLAGNVPPYLKEIKEILDLIYKNKIDQAFELSKKIFDQTDCRCDPSDKPACECTLNEVCEMSKVQLCHDAKSLIKEAISGKNIIELENIFKTLSFNLMAERLDSLQTDSETNTTTLFIKKKYWPGRNYFSLIFEPLISKKKPVLANQLDRILDRMLYRLEDKQVKDYLRLNTEFKEKLADYLKADDMFNPKR